jgi:uncharacterized protein YbjT (DUF2867 family)
MNKKIILVFGATGQQGGAVVRALFGSGFVIRAVTRDPDSQKAKALAQRGIELAKADFADESSIKQAMLGVYGVYSVHNMTGGLKTEVEQGKALADLAKQAEVLHFVYSSVGGAERKTGISHFESKWAVEEHIRSISLPHTIIRPVAFMENFTSFPTFMMFSILRSSLNNKKLQMIAVEDIGKWVALAFSKREQFLNQSIEIAGDELSYSELQDAWKRVKGKNQFAIALPKLFILVMGEMGRMFLWFGKDGYQADLKHCKNQVPTMTSFVQWVTKLKSL